MTFAALRDAVMRTYRSGRLAEALTLLDRHMADFPAHSATLGHLKALICGSLGQPEQSLEALRAVVTAGGWFTERAFINFEQLNATRALPGYQDLMAVCRQRHAEARATLKPELLTRCEAAAPAPVLLALHGNMSSAADSAPAWAPAVAQGCFLGLVQSTEILAPGMYVWDDWDQAAAQLQDHYRTAAAHSAADAARTVLGGFSAGAGVAAWAALRGSVPARGFVAMGPWIPQMDRVRAELAGARERGVRGYILVGEQDHTRPYATELHALMQQNEIPVAMEVIPDLPHTFPADFGERFARALKFILG